MQQGFVSRKNDGRGIERIRQLAYKLQGLPAQREVSITRGCLRFLIDLMKAASSNASSSANTGTQEGSDKR